MSAAATIATVGAALHAATSRLRAAGVASPALDARLLLARALGVSVELIVMRPERDLAPDAGQKFAALVARRAARQPMAQILGRREFWSLDFAVTGDTLAPRPESEEIVAAVLDALPDRAAPVRILDLGCGTGCLLLAVLSQLPRAAGVGVDISEAALDVSRGNATTLGLAARAEFVRGDWGAALDGLFDVVVSNPPYIASAEIATLDPDVRDFEPRLALDGGADGLDAYRRLAPQIARLLAPRGLAAIEIGAGQADDVAAIFEANDLRLAARRADLAGHVRCLVVTQK